MGQLFVWDKKQEKLVTAQEYYSDPEVNRAAYVIQDSMPATWHPADGQTYESKSAFRRITKAHGCVEFGNDITEKDIKPRESIKISAKGREEAIRRALYETGYKK